MNEVTLHRGRNPHLTVVDAFFDNQHLTEAVVCRVRQCTRRAILTLPGGRTPAFYTHRLYCVLSICRRPDIAPRDRRVLAHADCTTIPQLQDRDTARSRHRGAQSKPHLIPYIGTSQLTWVDLGFGSRTSRAKRGRAGSMSHERGRVSSHPQIALSDPLRSQGRGRWWLGQGYQVSDLRQLRALEAIPDQNHSSLLQFNTGFKNSAHLAHTMS